MQSRGRGLHGPRVVDVIADHGGRRQHLERGQGHRRVDLATRALREGDVALRPKLQPAAKQTDAFIKNEEKKENSEEEEKWMADIFSRGRSSLINLRNENVTGDAHRVNAAAITEHLPVKHVI